MGHRMRLTREKKKSFTVHNVLACKVKYNETLIKLDAVNAHFVKLSESGIFNCIVYVMPFQAHILISLYKSLSGCLCQNKTNSFQVFLKYTSEENRKYIRSLWPWPLSFKHSNLISNCDSLCQIWQSSLKAFLRYHIHNNNWMNIRWLRP